MVDRFGRFRKMASVVGSGGVDMGRNSLNFKLEIDNDDDIAMETDDDDDDIASLTKHNRKILEDETEEGELVEDKDGGLDGEPVFDEHRPLSRPNFPLTEPGKPLLKLIEEASVN